VTSLLPLLRTRVTAVWFVLIAATLVSWWLGTDHGFGSDHRAASVVVLGVAFFKARLVGLYFMDLRGAPLALRGIFEAYCLLVCGLVIGMFLGA
jgi:caa(3)-type oxidase subunit IV